MYCHLEYKDFLHYTAENVLIYLDKKFKEMKVSVYFPYLCVHVIPIRTLDEKQRVSVLGSWFALIQHSAIRCDHDSQDPQTYQ